MQPKAIPRRVLVVDDEPLIRWSVAETLSDRGFHVVESADASGARHAVRDTTHAFDAVLLDLYLPDSQDLSLLCALHRITPSTPLILMTAYGTPELARDAMALGAYGVVDKPFEIDDLAQIVSRAAEMSRPGVFPPTAN